MRKILLLVAFTTVLSAATGGTVQYAYDDAGRLVRVDYPSGTSIVYNYDANGNLLSRVTSGPSQTNRRDEAKPSSQPGEGNPRKRDRVRKHSAL